MKSLAVAAPLLAAAFVAACTSSAGHPIPSHTLTPSETVSAPPGTDTPTPTGTPHFFFVANRGSANVSVVREQSGVWSVAATIPVGPSPEGIVANPNGQFVYVAEAGAGTVRVLNALTFATSTAIPLGGAPHELAVNTPGTRLYVSDTAADRVACVSLASGAVVTTATVGPAPWQIAVSPGSEDVYIAAGASAVVLTGPGLSPVATVVVGGSLRGIALRTGTSYFLVTDSAGGRLATVSSSGWNLVSISGGPQGLGAVPSLLAFSPYGGLCYVPCEGAAETATAAWDATLTGASITVGSAPYGVASTGDGAFVVVTNTGSNSVSAISTATRLVVATIPVGIAPRGITVLP